MKVFKYPISYNVVPKQYLTLSLPKGAHVLYTTNSGFTINFYALVDDRASTELRTFVVCFTGVEVTDGRYIGSFDDGLVYHIFEDAV